MYNVFIDGQAGTTGLQIHQRLRARTDIQLLEIADKDRKNLNVKREILSEAEVVILCLPDDAAKETATLARETNTRVLDASTAHRTNSDWAYGLPELKAGQREKIQNANLVSNPGCYPTGFLLAVAPLVEAGVLNSKAQLSINAVSGYSGGGHKMIEQYEARSKSDPDNLWPSRPYALGLAHKHVPEMQTYAGLDLSPLFTPSVGHYLQGMLVSTPLAANYFTKQTSVDDIFALLEQRYKHEPCVKVHKPNDDSVLDQGFLDPQGNNGTNRNDIFIFGHETQCQVISQLDNLGKGAAGAAVQNLNLMLGADEFTGLEL